jgi:colicin import membrane protein
MWQLIKKHPLAAVAALLVHVLFVLILMVSIDWSQDETASTQQEKIDVIQARAVDEQQIESRVEKIREAERKQRQQQLEKKRQAEQARQRELQRQAELKKKRAEEKRQAALKKQREAEAKKRREEEARHQAELKKQAEEKKRREEEARKQREAEQQRQAEQELQAKMAAEAAQREHEAMLAANRGEIDKYRRQIKQQVARNWSIPSTARSGMVCEIMVRLLPSGDVVSVQVIKSSGDPALDRSVENAVYSAAPLPVPSVESGLFDEFREVKFSFDPKNRL